MLASSFPAKCVQSQEREEAKAKASSPLTIAAEFAVSWELLNFSNFCQTLLFIKRLQA